MARAMKYLNPQRGFVFLALVLATGCVPAHVDHYYWGQYESLIYDMYVKDGAADPGTQIDKLTADIQQAASLGRPVPPGVHAHLGIMHASVGNIAKAEDAFATEKQLYPESAVLIDGMMKRVHSKR